MVERADDPPDDLSEVEFTRLQRRAAAQRPDVLDDATGPIVVVHDVPDRTSRFVDVRRICVEEANSGLRVGENRGDRLIQFVRDAARDLADHRAVLRSLKLVQRRSTCSFEIAPSRLF